MPTQTAILSEPLIDSDSAPPIRLSREIEWYSMTDSEAQIQQQDDEPVSTLRLWLRYCQSPFLAAEKTPENAVCDFSDSVSAIPEVMAITYQMEDDAILVWTFISRRDKAVRALVYEMELNLMERYPALLFDFHVLSKENLLEPFIPQNLPGSVTFYKSADGN